MAFPFKDRLQHYSDVVKNSIAAFRAESTENLRSIHVHLTKKFSSDERRVLANSIRDAVPNAEIVFVSLNPHHILRLFNLEPSSNGLVRRGTYLLDYPGRVYVATTGRNPFSQRMMGTPIPLELTVWADPPSAFPTLQDVAQQILSLTRLNWASSNEFCHEPITTKYAGDIARFMVTFLDDPSFSVNSQLRKSPWFL